MCVCVCVCVCVCRDEGMRGKRSKKVNKEKCKKSAQQNNFQRGGQEGSVVAYTFLAGSTL